MTDDLQKKIDQLNAEHERKITEARREHEIRAILAPKIGRYRAPTMHFYPLYGASGSIRFSTVPAPRVTDDGPGDADAALLGALLAAYPPLDVVKVSEGTVSFRPDLAAAYGTEARPADVYECGGVIVKVETFQDQRAIVEWWALVYRGVELPARNHPTIPVRDDVWRFEFSVPLALTDFGRLDLHAVRQFGRGSGEILRYDRCHFYPNHDAQIIKWASGGPKYPNSFTLYWDRDSGAALDIPAITFAHVPKGDQ